MKRLLWFACASCSAPRTPASPLTPSPPTIDRFSAEAGNLMVRGGKHAFPAPGAPIDFDQPPFITQAFAPDGNVVRYYNFDVQRDAPATLYRATRAGNREPLAGQLDIVDVLPGDPTYSDFFRIAWVEVPASFTPGSAHALADLAAFPQTLDSTIIDCPIVPHGSTATEGDGVAPAVATQLLYRGATIDCLRFGDALHGERVPTSPIYVTFGHEPDTGFRHEDKTPQTHNVVLSVPGDVEYSPLWDVHIYDERAFEFVHDATTAQKAKLVKAGPLVNCPIVTVKKAPR